jgi:predicted Fe-S protein YdhL (DUF1289 family)
MSKPLYSPCIRICSINPKTGFCDGCYRALPEIAKWSRLPETERDRNVAQLPARGEQVAAMRAAGTA